MSLTIYDLLRKSIGPSRGASLSQPRWDDTADVVSEVVLNKVLSAMRLSLPDLPISLAYREYHFRSTEAP